MVKTNKNGDCEYGNQEKDEVIDISYSYSYSPSPSEECSEECSENSLENYEDYYEVFISFVDNFEEIGISLLKAIDKNDNDSINIYSSELQDIYKHILMLFAEFIKIKKEK